MRYFFIVQGEGRGHMTQALSLAQLIQNAGHELTHVVVGKSKRRSLPSFFTEKINAPIHHLESPNFVTDKDQKSVKPFRTLVHSLLHSPTYKQSIDQIEELVELEKPDVIINFYDFLGGLYNFTKRPKAKFICLAHQYLIGHPEFTFPPKRKLEKLSLRIGNKITSLGADKILALSFQEFSDMPRKKIFVVPPLLRGEIKDLQPSSGDHFLVYMVNPGYGEEVKSFHSRYPDQPLVCFWDKNDAPDVDKVDGTLTFHQLNDQKFIQHMASSKGYVTTAGFESVCEAMYLGKPVLMIPVDGQYEQACNAVDAVRAGAGISADHFSIEKLYDYISDYKDVSGWFRKWADQSSTYFLKHLEG